MTGATLTRPPVRHQEGKLPMLTQFPTFGDPRLPARFWAKVNPNRPIPTDEPGLDPCWEWTSHRNNKGYGWFHFGHRSVLAHRLAYETLIGPIPDGLESDHLCRNRGCVRPSHVEPVTRSVNVRRGARGSRLKAQDLAIIHALRGRLSQRKLAARFGVSHTHIGRIQRGERWVH